MSSSPKKYDGRIYSIADVLAAKTRRRGKCLVWTGGVNNSGYPQIHRRPSMFLLSRWVLEQKLGRPIRPTHRALHTCDNSRCLEKDHLYEGTEKQNALDRREGRARGFKLTRAKALKIRVAGGQNKEIGARYGVSESLVSMIKHRKVWP